jgi:hypothetical protein
VDVGTALVGGLFFSEFAHETLFQIKGPPPRSGLGIRGTAVLGAESAGREGLGKS